MMTEVVKGLVYEASAPTTVSLWFATVKNSGWLRAALMTLRRLVSPESMGTIEVSAKQNMSVVKIMNEMQWELSGQDTAHLIGHRHFCGFFIFILKKMNGA